MITSESTGYIQTCVICKEKREINKNEFDLLRYTNDISPQICPRCKQAILYARRMMENQGD